MPKWKWLRRWLDTEEQEIVVLALVITAAIVLSSIVLVWYFSGG